MNESKSKNYFEKLKDPLTIITLLLIINTVILIGLYFSLPIVRTINGEEDTYTEYYWNGNYQKYYSNQTFIDSGFDEDFKVAFSKLNISMVIISLGIYCALSLFLILPEKISRKKIINIVIWPIFIINGIIIASNATIILWGKDLFKDEIITQILFPLNYSFILAIAINVLVIALASLLSINNHKTKLNEK